MVRGRKTKRYVIDNHFACVSRKFCWGGEVGGWGGGGVDAPDIF